MRESQQELRRISELQRHLLPRELPSLPRCHLAAYYSVGPLPGGDYYNAWTLPDGRLVVFVADASGHNGLAAVLIAMVHVTLSSCPLASGVARTPICPIRDPVIQPPHVVLAHLNTVLHRNSLEEQFVTAYLGILDPADGGFEYASAGHPLPRWWRSSKRLVQAVPDIGGPPLGIVPSVTYASRRIEIAAGDMLVMHTDGLIEAQTSEGGQYGRDRLDEAIRQAAPKGAEAVQSAILASLARFMGNTSPLDDITVLILQRTPDPVSRSENGQGARPQNLVGTRLGPPTYLKGTSHAESS